MKNKENDQPNDLFLKAQEKASNVFEMEQSVIQNHLLSLKKSAEMLGIEGNLLNEMAEKNHYEDGELEAYVEKMQKLIEQKLLLYQKLG